MQFTVYIDIKLNHQTNSMYVIYLFLSISKTITNSTNFNNQIDLTIIPVTNFPAWLIAKDYIKA